jgi:threonine dehydrogenase-like Zn-dependent dehydrogenase
VIDVPMPAITDTQVLIKVKAAGVCHSDIMAFKGQHPYRVPPVITGHEAAGEVAAVGRAVTRVKPGDRVVIEPHIGCGTCWFCQRGEYNVCPDKRLIGVGAWTGVFAEYVMAEGPMCFRMPDGMSWEEGAAVEPFVVGLHAVRHVELPPGGTAAVLGCGTIGLTVLLSLKLLGAGAVFATDVSAAKRDLAVRLGAAAAFDPTATDAVRAVIERTGGLGVDAAFVNVSVPAVLSQGLQMCRRRGTVVDVAVFPGDTAVPLWLVQNFERRLVGTAMYTGADYDMALREYAQGRVNLKALLSQRVSLRDSPAVIRRLARGEMPDDIKTIITFDEEETR